jgi:Domain of unknown function (DUF1998)
MMRMSKNPIRRAQLIAPFGVGSMMVVQDGTSLISGGLDHWYQSERETKSKINIEEFCIEEWRLQKMLGVDHFRLPPDYREEVGMGVTINQRLNVPFLRFPQWHFCPGCKRLSIQPLTARGRIKCPECKEKGKTRYLAQVPFVAMCKNGHLQDFPWNEWVHKSIHPTCQRSLRIVATGGASLADQKVKCECGDERSLAQITEASSSGENETTELSKNLDKEGQPYLCPGKQPWLGTEEGGECGLPIRGSLRSASNLYYADVRSSIYLPRGNSQVPAELVSLLERPPYSTIINVVSSISLELTIDQLKKKHGQLLQDFSDDVLSKAIKIVLSGSAENTNWPDIKIESEDQETAFRREEFEILRQRRNEDSLIIRQPNIDTYNPLLRKYFSRIMLVSKLRETRALAGFTRILPENDQKLDIRKAMLRKNISNQDNDDWLPAYIVHGEGIFLELKEELLRIWELQQKVHQRMSPLIQRAEQMERNKKMRGKPIGPRFILLHTFSHLIMNRLTFECGYSSAALRERLYVSENLTAPMMGLLIYTAAGDSEGTMGGLVRMGQPGNLEPIIQKALTEARWCSSDPVCMEMGDRGGQGPESCNLAACHNCSLVPETACEEFNRFLDRAAVVGKVGDRKLGFFDLDSL